jgi:hypothetical protein
LIYLAGNTAGKVVAEEPRDVGNLLVIGLILVSAKCEDVAQKMT